MKDLEEDLKKEYDIFNQAWSEIFDLVQVCALLHSMRLPVFPREYIFWLLISMCHALCYLLCALYEMYR